MKKAGIAAFLLFTLTMGANAQKRKCGNENGKQNKGMHREFGAKLNLTEDQKVKAKALNAGYKSKMEALKADKNITVGDMEKQRTGIQAAKKKELDALLTPEQKTKMAEARKNKSANHTVGYGKKRGDFKKDLNLSEQQKAVLKTNKENALKQKELIKNDKSLTPEQQRFKLKELKEKNKQSFMQTLTPEQQEKMKKMPKKRKENKQHVK
jgi:Spy/CpxP family protein refolding chaperone